jgi:hypothetical protein
VLIFSQAVSRGRLLQLIADQASGDAVDIFGFCDGFNTHHVGTLRFRQEGASTPSTASMQAIVQADLDRSLSFPKRALVGHRRFCLT